MRLRRDSRTGKFVNHNLGFAARQTGLRSALGSRVSFAFLPWKVTAFIAKGLRAQMAQPLKPPGTLRCSCRSLLLSRFGRFLTSTLTAAGSGEQLGRSWERAMGPGRAAWSSGLCLKRLSALYP